MTESSRSAIRVERSETGRLAGDAARSARPGLSAWVPAALLLAGFAGWTAWGALTTQGFLEADEVNHWLHARHAPAHPTNLIQPWGRPLYTLLLLPLSQLGLPASRLLAVVSAAVAAACAALAARALGWRCWPCAIPAAYAQPLFFQQTYGIWTEVTFAALLGAWMLALVKQRPIAVAVVAAALPLVRPEGFLIAAATGIAALAGALRDRAGAARRVAPIAILPSGVVLWALLGFAASGDLLWVPRHWPSDWAPSASYGSGSWTWLGGSLATVVPVALLPFAAVGCFASGMRRVWPVLLAVALVLGTHAVLWKVGAFGSAGYARYFVTLAPVFALLIAGGAEVLLGRLARVMPSWVVSALAAGLAVVLLLKHPTATVLPPMPRDGLIFEFLGTWISVQDPDAVLHSAHPFAYLGLRNVPAERFDDFGGIRRETLRDAPPGTWLLVEDRLYGPHRPPNPDATELHALGFRPVSITEQAMDMTAMCQADAGSCFLATPDPRHDPAIARMTWTLWRKTPR